MGVKNAHLTFYSIKNLKKSEIATICHGLAQEQNIDHPSIDVDCSNVAFKCGRNARSLSKFLNDLANMGVKVVPICDAKTRPICKQASNERQANRKKSHIKSFILRQDIKQSQVQIESLTGEERLKMSKNVAKLIRECKAAERAFSNSIPINFPE